MNAIALFAQIAAPAPGEIAAFLGCLFFLVAGWNQLERFLDRRSRRPGPPPDPAPARSEVADLQRHLAKIDREVGELRTGLDLTHQQLARLEAKLDRLVERNLP
ncbi:MAG TPA: hypothetical protein P5038_13320 [Candidatus Paceibacterota bacterium]|nr:hypothetical protein [Candidatus Paceibacterota bacterium]HRT57600.1 hypothetical protein [Candidatus Paceibacterota bacterium]